MLYRVVFLFTIGLIASCAAEGSQVGAEAVPEPVESVVPTVVDEVSNAAPVVEVSNAAPVEDVAAPVATPAKACASRNYNKNKRYGDDSALSCRGGQRGSRRCREICGLLGFKLASCKTTSYKPRASNSSCVCSNDGKLGVVASEYEGPASLRRMPGYYEKHFPMKAPCSDCSCNKACEAYRMSPDDKGIAPYTKGSCVQRSCVCLKAFHAENEEKQAKKRNAKKGPRPQFRNKQKM